MVNIYFGMMRTNTLHSFFKRTGVYAWLLFYLGCTLLYFMWSVFYLIAPLLMMLACARLPKYYPALTPVQWSMMCALSFVGLNTTQSFAFDNYYNNNDSFFLAFFTPVNLYVAVGLCALVITVQAFRKKRWSWVSRLASVFIFLAIFLGYKFLHCHFTDYCYYDFMDYDQ